MQEAQCLVLCVPVRLYIFRMLNSLSHSWKSLVHYPLKCIPFPVHRELISTDWDNSVQYIREEKEDVHQAVNEQGLIERAGETKLWPLVPPLKHFSDKIPTLQERIATGTF